MKKSNIESNDKKVKGWVYGIQNVVTKQWYVGKTRQGVRSKKVEDRWNDHIKLLNKGIHHNIKLQRSWEKYSSKSFMFMELFFIEDDLFIVDKIIEAKEIDLTLKMKADANNGGFVLKIGGGGGIVSDETRDRMSESSPNNRPILKLTLDGYLVKKYKSAMSAAKEHNFTHGTITMAATSLSRTAAGHLFVYEDTYKIYKDSEIEIKYKKPSYRSKSVVQLSVDGDYIDTFPSREEAKRKLKLTHISTSNENLKNTYGGFRFMLESEYIEKGFYLNLEELNKKNLRPVVKLSPTFELDEEFDSIEECCKKLNMTKEAVTSRCSKYRVLAQEFILMYKDVYFEMSDEDIDSILGEVKNNRYREPVETIPTVQLSLNGEFIKRYSSLIEIDKNTQYKQQCISVVSKTLQYKNLYQGKGQKTAYGYLWLEEEYYNSLTPLEILDIVNYANSWDRSHFRKGVVMLNQKGEIIKKYDSIESASTNTGISSSMIIGSCKVGEGSDKIKNKMAKGYIFVYEKDFYSEGFKFDINKYRDVRHKYIVALDLSGKYINTYGTCKEAGEEIGVHRGAVSISCSSDFPKKKRCKDRIFFYEEEYLAMKDEYIENMCMENFMSKFIVQIDPKTFDVINEYESIANVKATKIFGDVGPATRGKQKQHKGYLWLKKNDYIYLNKNEMSLEYIYEYLNEKYNN